MYFISKRWKDTFFVSWSIIAAFAKKLKTPSVVPVPVVRSGPFDTSIYQPAMRSGCAGSKPGFIRCSRGPVQKVRFNCSFLYLSRGPLPGGNITVISPYIPRLTLYLNDDEATVGIKSRQVAFALGGRSGYNSTPQANFLHLKANCDAFANSVIASEAKQSSISLTP